MRMRSFLLSTALLAGFSLPVLAQNNIGEVAIAQREVTGAFAGRTTNLKYSDPVIQNQVVSTGQESLARIAFHDLTTVAMGPQASIKLDRFLYNPDATGAGMTLNMARGAFRFVTGRTKSDEIKINTPLATIGVRGTVVDVKVRPGRVITVLRQGESYACRGRACVTVTEPGTGLIITARGIEGPTERAAAEFDFDSETANYFAIYRHANANNPRGEAGVNDVAADSAPAAVSESYSSQSSYGSYGTYP